MQTSQFTAPPALNMAGALFAGMDIEAQAAESSVTFTKVKSRQLLTAQAWELLAEAYSADLLCEQRGDEAVSVRYTPHGGYIFTTTGCCFGGLVSKCTTDSYRLIPLALYMGPTYRNHRAMQAEYDVSRERGNHSGLIVKAAGQLVVMADRVTFVCGMPTTPPIELRKAVEFNTSESRYGWRSIFASQAEVSWWTYQGHPVVRYLLEDDEIRTILFWQAPDQIKHIFLPADVELIPAVLAPEEPQKVVKQPEQIGLF